MAKRRISENTGAVSRLLFFYAAIAIALSLADRLFLPRGDAFLVKLGVLCVAALGAVTHCVYHIRPDSRGERIAFVVLVAAINGLCCTMSATFSLRSVDRYIGELWALAVAGAAPTFVTSMVWMPFANRLVGRWREFIKPGQCRNCGYDLTGNVSGRCPECGEEMSAPPPNGLRS